MITIKTKRNLRRLITPPASNPSTPPPQKPSSEPPPNNPFLSENTLALIERKTPKHLADKRLFYKDNYRICANIQNAFSDFQNKIYVLVFTIIVYIFPMHSLKSLLVPYSKVIKITIHFSTICTSII